MTVQRAGTPRDRRTRYQSWLSAHIGVGRFRRDGPVWQPDSKAPRTLKPIGALDIMRGQRRCVGVHMIRLLLIVALVEAVLIAWLISGRSAASAPEGPIDDGGMPGLEHGEGLDSPTSTEALARGVDGEAIGVDDPAPQSKRNTSVRSPAIGAGASATASGRRVTADTPGILHGTIRYSDGQKVDRWNRVWLFAEGQEAIALHARKDGTYAGAGLAPGRYEAHVSTWAARGMSKVIEVEPGGRIRADFEYESFLRIPVKILAPSGKSLFDDLRGGDRGAWKWLDYDFAVIATKGPPGQGPAPSMNTSFAGFGIGRYAGQGRYGNEKTDDGRQGTLYVPADQWPLHVSLCLRTEILATQLVSERPESLSFTIDEERFEKLLSGITFTLSGDGPPSEVQGGKIILQNLFLDDVELSAFERKGDRITIRDRVPGRHALALMFGKELEDYECYVDLPAGEILDLGHIHLRKATMDKLRFLDADGAPLAGASTHFLDVARTAADQPTEFGRNTDADGGLTCSYGPGRYFVILNAPDGDTTYGTEIEVPLPEGAPHEIRLPRAYSANVRLGASLTSPVHFAVLAGPNRHVQSGSQTPPRIMVLKFGEGSYTAVATEADGTVHRVPFDVGPDHVPTIVIEKGAK
jgi:hypothetical protein